VSISVYTLLIVESPVLAGIIQKVCPPSVYVLSTGGFCWRPGYDAASNQLKAIADPSKREFRKELKEQAEWANRVVIATDHDASGDFIAWSVARFLNLSGIQRGRLQTLSKQGIFSMLSEVQEIDFSRLETHLKNRFLIQHCWNQSKKPDSALAGVVAVLGTSERFQHFLDQNGNMYKSSVPFRCLPDEWISIQPTQNKNHIRVYKPLSTFDLFVPALVGNLAESCRDVQLLLQQLFQTLLQFSGESLISYPRTSARAFYSETWETIRNQYMKIGPVSELKPRFLQEIADPDCPHESIHPLNLSHSPDKVKGELPQTMGMLYEWIYNHTLRCITMPDALDVSFTNELNPGIYFYSEKENAEPGELPSVRPCITIGDLGESLNELGVCKPSSFGKNLDDWIAKRWIHVKGHVVTPGSGIIQYLNSAEWFSEKLKDLNALKTKENLTPETVRTVLAS
jgi:hypothetical protein